MSIPCAYGAGESDRAVADHHLREADVDAVHAARRATRTSSSIDAARALDVDAVLAADHGQVPDLDAVGADDDPAADDRARLADERLLARRSRAGPGGRPPRASPSAAASRRRRRRRRGRARRPRPRPPTRPGARARRRRRRTRAAATGRRRARAPARAATSRAKKRDRRRRAAPARRRDPRERHHDAELERAERQRDPARLVVEARGRRRATSSASPTPTISAAISTGHQRWSASARTAAATRGPERREQARVEPASQRVRHACHPPQEAVRRVLRADERVGRRIGPLRGDAGERERALVVGERRARCSPARARSSRRASRARARRRAARAAGRARKPRLKPVAQMTCSAPFTSAATRNRVAGALERLVPGAAGRIRGREQRREERRALGRRRSRGSRRARGARRAAAAR